MMKRIALLVPVVLLFVALAPIGAQKAEASTYYYFKTPQANAAYTVGDEIPISFYAGVENSTTECDAWGRPTITTYEDMPVTLKVFKGSTELESIAFTYNRATTIETTYTPMTVGTLKLRLYGRNLGLNVYEQTVQDTLVIKVKKKKASAVKSIKPIISVGRVAKKTVEITCENDFGFGMKVYRADKKNGKYELIGTTSKSTYKDKKIKATKAYYYKVRLYAKSGKKTYISKWSAKKAASKDVASKIVLSYSGSKGVKVSWKAIKGAGYYLVSRRMKGEDTYEVISCEDSTTTTYYDKDVQKGKTYYYAIVAEKGDGVHVGKYMDNKYKISI